MGVNLGFTKGQVVQELYYDEDVDQPLRQALAEAIGAEPVSWDYDDLVDGIILWWRADDAAEEDLADALSDIAQNMADEGGLIWVFSPKPGRGGEVPAESITEASDAAGMQATSSISAGKDWVGIRLVNPPRV